MNGTTITIGAGAGGPGGAGSTLLVNPPAGLKGGDGKVGVAAKIVGP